jgi:hypothetical protein
VDAPRLHAAAGRLWGGTRAVPSFLYVNITAPTPGVDAGHVDVPAFRGIDHRSAPGWFLLAMQRCGLFERWAVRTATAVVWFYDGEGGALRYWPEGPDGPPRDVAPRPNTAIVGDNDRMFHCVKAVGDPSRWRPYSRDALLCHAGGDRWEVRDGGEVVAYRLGELRISLSWKAAVVPDREAQPEQPGEGDVTLERALEVMGYELRRRGSWDDRPLRLGDPELSEAIMETFPRRVPGPSLAEGGAGRPEGEGGSSPGAL